MPNQSGAPGLLREMSEEIRTIHDFVIKHEAEHVAAAELIKQERLPERLRKVEDYLKYGSGFVAGLLALEGVRTLFEYVVPATVAAFGGK